MTTSVSRGYAARPARPRSTATSLPVPGEQRSVTPRESVPELLRVVDDALMLLRARGFPAGTQLLAQRYARLLSAEALDLEETQDEDRHPDEDPHRPQEGHHARDRAGMRYWIVGRRGIPGGDADAVPGVVVPGVPDRAFDRIVLTRFDPDFGIEFAGSARASAFLRAAEYDEGRNEWVLDATDPFWSGPDVGDRTALFRVTARRLDHSDQLSAEESRTVGSAS